MTDTEKYLAEIKARAEKAAPGPWVRKGRGVRFRGDFEGYQRISPKGFGGGDPSLFEKQSEIDAEFIAHARTDIPRLVAMVEVARRGLQDEDNHWHAPNEPVHGYRRCTACDALAELERLAGGGPNG